MSDYYHESGRRNKWVYLFAVANVAVFAAYLPPYAHLLDFRLGELVSYLWVLFDDGGYPEWALYYPTNPDVFQLFSHQFAHAGLYHLGSNMVALISCGRMAEPTYGKYLIVIYLLGGVAGGLAHGFWDIHPLLGSSGAVSAVLGSCLALNIGWRSRAGVLVFWLFLYNMVPLFLAFDNISYVAHIGGFVAGIILGVVYVGVSNRRNRTQYGRA